MRGCMWGAVGGGGCREGLRSREMAHLLLLAPRRLRYLSSALEVIGVDAGILARAAAAVHAALLEEAVTAEDDAGRQPDEEREEAAYDAARELSEGGHGRSWESKGDPCCSELQTWRGEIMGDHGRSQGALDLAREDHGRSSGALYLEEGDHGRSWEITGSSRPVGGHVASRARSSRPCAPPPA